ncbi:MAG: glycosyltransferase family 2 protein [Patescibacteria group bacterium]
MGKKISAVLNTFNDEKNITGAVQSVKWADEIIICDMYSDDKTVEIAKKLGAKVVFHKRVRYVEPARNFAIAKASNDWVLVLDPDEEVPETLAKRLVQIASSMRQINYVRIPRKNIIFNKWMKASMWWPDLNVRFFKRGKVKWNNNIHRQPKVSGEGLDLEEEEKWAIVHYNYQTIEQFINRMNRYTAIEAEELKSNGYKFEWSDLIQKPLSEFLSRFFANKGYTDGLHGLALSLLQALSFLVVYLKVWEKSSFEDKVIKISDLEQEKRNGEYQINYWFKQAKAQGNPFKKILSKFI